MQITYDPTEKVGHQFSIALPDGRRLSRVAASTVEGLLRSSGLSIRESAQKLADARLAAA